MKSILELSKRHLRRVAKAQNAKRRRGRDDDPFSPGRMEFRKRMDKSLAEAKLEFFEAWATSRLKR